MYGRDAGNKDSRGSRRRASNIPSTTDTPSSPSPPQPYEDNGRLTHNFHYFSNPPSGSASNLPSGQSISYSSQRPDPNCDPYVEHVSLLGPPGRPPGSPERPRYPLPPPHSSSNPWGSSTLIPALPQFGFSTSPDPTALHSPSDPTAAPVRYPTSEYRPPLPHSEFYSGAHGRGSQPPHTPHPADTRYGHSPGNLLHYSRTWKISEVYPVRYDESTPARHPQGWNPRDPGNPRDIAPPGPSPELSREARYIGSQSVYQSQRHPHPTARGSQMFSEAAWSTQPNTIYPTSKPHPQSQTMPPPVHAPHSSQRQPPPPIPEPSSSASSDKRHIRHGKRKLSVDDHSPERKIYHPKAPSGGSDWVMWVGNIPSDTTQDDATAFFQSIPDSFQSPPGSHCAFVNYSSEPHLQRALQYFNGRPFRNGGVKLLCRVRKRNEEIKSGVGAQRGLGFHRKWVKEHALERAVPSQSNEVGSASISQTNGISPSSSLISGSSDESTGSSNSTTSSLLATHFPIRYFVLKAMTKSDLHLSVVTGFWATQVHNETILNQAFRTSRSVYLIFGANKAGEFYGYAKMETPIKNIDDTAASWPRNSPTASSRSATSITSTFSGTHISPFEQHLRQFDSLIMQSPPPTTTSTGGSELPTKESPSVASSASSPTYGGPSVSGKTEQNEDRNWGTPFRVKWIRVGSIPFHQTRMLRNPWNKDREVKVSRDGTELEPSVGQSLIDLWASLDQLEPSG
ncbi:hypothetical protein BS47DRAFT_1343824 [Hydnum rufescens UP504]|uniref:YTH domain-containing protein n=1 Tax=Hydnum rufescens UP504 TaxID=1448309 RepID=A0A9P6AXR9_9AGAM|nr:hypothetical protein BS47DRAFT_1343824 [Hydnum rufescens UP504]